MLNLFEPGKIGKLQIKNRIVMAPMGIGGLAEPDGTLSPEGIDYYVARAKGGVGLIITGSARVSQEIEYSGGVRLLAVNGSTYIARLSELAERLHNFGAKFAVQLIAGMGRVIDLASLRKGGAVAPSPVPYFWDSSITVRELTTEEVERLVRAFELGAEIARASGVDAIEINAHNGYLADQFQTALWNRRTDKYGGGLEGRLRFAMEVIKGIRKGAGEDFPIIYRFGLTHYLDGGRVVEEGLEIAKRLEAEGVDAFHIDAGCYETRYWASPPTTQPPGCMVDLAEMVKKVVKVPVIAVGKLGYPDLAERVLREGKADFIALGRALLADPEWPNKVREGRLGDIRPCIGCYEGCTKRLFEEGTYISCAVNPMTGREREFTITPAAKKKSVLVVGGGPAGMEAARVAALRGHRVTLWEKGDTLGGNLIPASIPGFKQDYRSLINYLSTQIKKLGVTTRLKQQATPQLIEEMNPDVVLIATGATPIILGIPGVEKDKVVTATDLLLGRKEAGDSVVVIGGNLVGCETALYLAQKGKKLTIVEILDSTARDMFVSSRMHLMKLLAESNVKILTRTNVLEITDEGITIADEHGERGTLDADTVVLAVGLKSNDELLKALKHKVPKVYAIGDCVEPHKVINAIWEGFHTARLI